jgi:hypothetical protein
MEPEYRCPMCKTIQVAEALVGNEYARINCYCGFKGIAKRVYIQSEGEVK